jgi:hypothetical protein
MPSASGLPPSDRVVVALWRAGQERAARQYAGYAIARNDPARAVLRRLAEALERGEPPPAGDGTRLSCCARPGSRRRIAGPSA